MDNWSTGYRIHEGAWTLSICASWWIYRYNLISLVRGSHTLLQWTESPNQHRDTSPLAGGSAIPALGAIPVA